MPGLLQLRAHLAAENSHVVSFREVKLDFELYYIIQEQQQCLALLLTLNPDLVVIPPEGAIPHGGAGCGSREQQWHPQEHRHPMTRLLPSKQL